MYFACWKTPINEFSTFVQWGWRPFWKSSFSGLPQHFIKVPRSLNVLNFLNNNVMWETEVIRRWSQEIAKRPNYNNIWKNIAPQMAAILNLRFKVILKVKLIAWYGLTMPKTAFKNTYFPIYGMNASVKTLYGEKSHHWWPPSWI